MKNSLKRLSIVLIGFGFLLSCSSKLDQTFTSPDGRNQLDFKESPDAVSFSYQLEGETVLTIDSLGLILGDAKSIQASPWDLSRSSAIH